MDAGEIRSLLQNAFPGAEVDVYGPDGVHFEARLIAPAFAGKATLARHRMVYAALGNRMGNEIHALSLRTLTPDEASGPGTRDSGPGNA